MRICYEPFGDPADGINPAATLDALDPADQHPDLLRAWVEQDASRAPTLLLVGPTGRGKTFAAHAVAHAFRVRGMQPGQLFGVTESKHVAILTGTDEHASLRQQELRQAAVIILDELGASYTPGVDQADRQTRQALRDLLGLAVDGRRLVVTTTFTAQDVTDVYGEDIASRLAHRATVVRYEGHDRRAPEGATSAW